MGRDRREGFGLQGSARPEKHPAAPIRTVVTVAQRTIDSTTLRPPASHPDRVSARQNDMPCKGCWSRSEWKACSNRADTV